jgi:hypothetical protein
VLVHVEESGLGAVVQGLDGSLQGAIEVVAGFDHLIK